MSLRASGNVGGVLAYRQQPAGQTAQYPRRAGGAASPRQLRRRSRFAEAAAVWKAMDAIDRLPWHSEAAKIGLDGRKLYIREYLIQQVIAPARPLLPTTY